MTEPEPSPNFEPVNVAVLTVSDTRTSETDASGAYIVQQLTDAGHRVTAQRILPDSLVKLKSQFEDWIENPEIQVVITTGGTGITGRDVTPDALEPLITKRIDGFGELFRALSYHDIGPATIQSRAIGAICQQTLVFLLPGSTGACQLAMQKILLPQLDRRTMPCNFPMLFGRL
jgi:molybdenum cofactor biosynthesis protein B